MVSSRVNDYQTDLLIGESGPGSNGNEGVTTLFKTKEPYYWMQFRVISRMPLCKRMQLVFPKSY